MAFLAAVLEKVRLSALVGLSSTGFRGNIKGLGVEVLSGLRWGVDDMTVMQAKTKNFVKV